MVPAGGWLLVSKALHTLIVPPHLHHCQHAFVSAAISHNLTGLFSASEDNQVCSFNPIQTGWGCTRGATSLCSENGPLIRWCLWPFQEDSLTKSRESLRGISDAVVKQVINGCWHAWRRRNMRQFSLFYFMASWSETHCLPKKLSGLEILFCHRKTNNQSLQFALQLPRSAGCKIWQKCSKNHIGIWTIGTINLIIL